MNLFSVEEMADKLKLSPHTIYAATSRCNRSHVKVSLPPWIKNGKRILFPEEDFLRWLAEQERHDGTNG